MKKFIFSTIIQNPEPAPPTWFRIKLGIYISSTAHLPLTFLDELLLEFWLPPEVVSDARGHHSRRLTCEFELRWGQWQYFFVDEGNEHCLLLIKVVQELVLHNEAIRVFFPGALEFGVNPQSLLCYRLWLLRLFPCGLWSSWTPKGIHRQLWPCEPLLGIAWAFRLMKAVLLVFYLVSF